jgi:hypothetical protein
MSLARYAMWVMVAVLGPLALLQFFLGPSDPLAVRSAAFGGALAALNAIAAYGLVSWSQGRSTNAFLGAVLGGMVARMGLLLGAVALGLGAFDLARLPLVTALLGYFVVFLVLEMRILNRRSPVLEPTTR